jgi:hypothetical protein
MNPVMEESVESILDASDLSFEESRDDILGESRVRPGGYGQQQRRLLKIVKQNLDLEISTHLFPPNQQ